MLYLAFIFHMHQPYYKNLLTGETSAPWVRLHGTKDYLDMVQMLDNFPRIRQTFNVFPSLIEQVEDYVNQTVKDKLLEISYRPAAELTAEEKSFILDKFFMISPERVIARIPRYYELYFKKLTQREFTVQDFLDLQVWFNLAWIDPYFRVGRPELKRVMYKARFFSEEDKQTVLAAQIEILKEIIPTYKRMAQSGQVEFSVTPYYHPILPLLYSTNVAKEANPKATLPQTLFPYPQDALAQIDSAVKFYKDRFGAPPQGMWPSEEAVSEHILPFIIKAGIKWIVADEGILFKSLKKKKRDTLLLYQPHVLRRGEGDLNIVFRDRNLSDLIGFTYYHMSAVDAVNNFLGHLENINKVYTQEDILVTVAMDGENAWEYYVNDGHDFLELLYRKLSDSEFIKTTTVSEYLSSHPPKSEIKRIAAGSWIYTDFFKWINNPYKNKAWEYLAAARKEFESFQAQTLGPKLELATKQMHILEGSDWFWWYGEKNPDFDWLFRMHLKNFYTIIGKEMPEYLNRPLE